MELDWNQIVMRGKSGIGVSESEALAITKLRETDELIAMLEAAEAVRVHHKGNQVNTCGITNAKSGRCPEKCNFCSQSAHFSTEAPTFTTKAADTIVAEAEAAFEGGVREFSIVMAGRQIDSEADLSTLESAFPRSREHGHADLRQPGLMSKDNLAPAGRGHAVDAPQPQDRAQLPRSDCRDALV